MPGRSCPVLIVGAGVGGVAASTLPAHQGVHSLLVEKRREVFVCPTACNLTFRSLEILRRLGPGPSTRSPTTSLPSAEGLSPEVFGKYCPQSKLEPMLLAETRRLGSEVRYGVNWSRSITTTSGVTATVQDLDSSALSVVHADYLLAADGTRSPVRRQLGISATGCVSNLGDGDAVQINNPDLDGIFVVAQHAEPGPLPESPERELRQVLCRMLSRH